MKISVVTPTYNRGDKLINIYNSLLKNLNYGIDIEWLIMDDGSKDNTKEVVNNFIEKKQFKIIYKYQDNQGKMAAINNIIEKATGEILIELDSDDYFTDNALNIIKDNINKVFESKDIYALVFTRKMKESDNDFLKDNYKSKMFDLYYRENLTGETTIVFKSEIRKKYKYKLEKNERFITESRMYHEMDLEYNILYINEEIVKGEYIEDGYSKNIKRVFLKNPFGYYEFFLEMLNRDLNGVRFSKKLYIYKHYILFTVLTKNKNFIKNINKLSNKIIIILLYLPGYIKSINFKK